MPFVYGKFTADLDLIKIVKCLLLELANNNGFIFNDSNGKINSFHSTFTAILWQIQEYLNSKIII